MRLVLVGFGLTALLLVAALAVGWVFSSRFLVPAPYSLMPEFDIVAVADDEVTLPAPPAAPGQFADTRKEGVYTLLWEGGYARLGEVVADDGAQLVRALGGVVGRPPQSGDPARLDVVVFRRDPLADHGIPFEDLELEGRTGRLRAWWIDRHGDAAVLVLHGRRRADLREGLRILPTLVEAGSSVMLLAYRNHDLSDPDPGGFYHYGQHEADDVLTALDALAERGIERVVLYGFSMGGAVALEAIERWPADAPTLAGLVLDSPLLDPRTVIRRGARDLGLPAADALADLALLGGGWRAGIDWRGLDGRLIAADLTVPTLLIAGTDDATIPIDLVDDFAARMRAPLDYRRLDGVEHVEAWNRVPQAYEAWVSAFMRARLPPD